MSYIITAYNRKIDYRNPSPEQILIDDIAIGLSNMPRFAGQLQHFYSVAEHCVLAERWYYMSDPEPSKYISLAILMHDATEAYMCDVPTPLKKLLPDYMKMEADLMEVIRVRFNIYSGPEVDHLVEMYDLLMLKNEALHERGRLNWLNDKKYKDIPELPNFVLYHFKPEDIRLIFMKRFNELTQ